MSETGPAEVADRARLLRAAGALKVPTLLVRGRDDAFSETVQRFLDRHDPV